MRCLESMDGILDGREGDEGERKETMLAREI